MEAPIYSMAVGDLDTARLALLNDHYDPSSRAFCETAGISLGDKVADIGCGHGSMTRWLAARVGPQESSTRWTLPWSSSK